MGRARSFTEEVIAGHVDGVDEVLLMTSELVANVIEHAHGLMRLTVRVGPPLRIEVHNHQAATDAFRELVGHPVMPDPTAPSGRGLALVRILSTRMGLDDDPSGGKVVWFEYDSTTPDVVAAVRAGGHSLGHGVVEGPNSS